MDKLSVIFVQQNGEEMSFPLPLPSPLSSSLLDAPYFVRRRLAGPFEITGAMRRLHPSGSLRI